ERREAEGAERAGGKQIAARDAEQVAEEEAVEARRRGRREREQRAEPEERRDDDGDGDVARDRGQPCDERDSRRGDQDAAGGAQEQRQTGERRDDEPGEERVRERLGAVGEPVEDDPAAEHGAERADEEELEERPLHERVAPRMEDRVRHACSWWWGGRTTAVSPAAAGSGTISAPYVRSSTSRVSVSAGGPNAIWRRLRQRTRSH